MPIDGQLATQTDYYRGVEGDLPSMDGDSARKASYKRLLDGDLSPSGVIKAAVLVFRSMEGLIGFGGELIKRVVTFKRSASGEIG